MGTSLHLIYEPSLILSATASSIPVAHIIPSSLVTPGASNWQPCIFLTQATLSGTDTQLCVYLYYLAITPISEVPIHVLLA